MSQSPSPFTKATVGLVLLAAGESKRMVSPKQLLKIGSDSLIYQMTKKALRSSCFPVVVVVGASKSRVISEIENLPVFITENLDWEKGVSSTIKIGIREMLRVYPPVKAGIIMVVDQPHISTPLLNELVYAYEANATKSIIASTYEGTCGTPVLFDKKWFVQLMKLKGDKGAKALITKCPPSELVTINFDKGGVELDTLEDYLLFQQESGLSAEL